MFHKYKNGNYIVKIDDVTGTKIKISKDDEFLPQFPESIDVSIGRRCDGGCQYCYEGATADGPEGDLLNAPFIDSLHPFTEIAINGNSIDHPQLVEFLKKLKKKHIFANMTVNQRHFESKENLIKALIETKMITGLGISLVHATDDFIRRVKSYPTAVIHTIYGVTTMQDYIKLMGHDLKILILGYKDKGRGHDYLLNNEEKINQAKQWLKDNVEVVMKDDWYKLVTFDNLALEQLDIKSIITPMDWEYFYAGDDGTCTFYIDMVDKTFGKSSLVPKSEMMPWLDSVDDMLQVIRSL